MSRPLLLDLFCGQGGAASGYARAGFDVVGVDAAPDALLPVRLRTGRRDDLPRWTWGSTRSTLQPAVPGPLGDPDPGGDHAPCGCFGRHAATAARRGHSLGRRERGRRRGGPPGRPVRRQRPGAVRLHVLLPARSAVREPPVRDLVPWARSCPTSSTCGLQTKMVGFAEAWRMTGGRRSFHRRGRSAAAA